MDSTIIVDVALNIDFPLILISLNVVERSLLSCPLLIGINSIYDALQRHVDNVSFIVTAHC